tara:strand:- start:2990 stop:4084 length:1095 start_codon:yes stop_codon:yes gene_type:complete
MNYWRAVVQAAKADDLETIRELMTEYPELVQNDRALVTSARYGHEDIVMFLLGETPELESVRKALVAAVFPYRSVPKTERHGVLVRTLLWKVPEERQKAAIARQLIDAAARSGCRPIADALIEVATQDVYTSAAFGDLDTVQEWTKQSRSIVRHGDESGKTALHYCAASALGLEDDQVAQGLVNVAQHLLEWGAEVSARCRPERESPFGLTPLDCAVLYGDNPDLVSVLVNHGAQELESALWELLVHRRDPGEIQYRSAGVLLDAGASLDRPFNGRTILQDLAHHGSEESVRWAIAHGADIYAQTSDLRTALHLSADRDDGEAIVDALLAAGADPAVTDEAGHAPLWYADKGERQAIVDRLRTS